MTLSWRLGSARERWLAACVALLLLGIGVDYVVRSAYLPRRAELSEEIQRHESLLRRNQQLKTRADLIRREYDALQRSQKSAPTTAPASEAELLRAIESTAEDTVALLSIDPVQTDRDGQPLFAVVLECTGDLHGIARFLESLSTDNGGHVDSVFLSVEGSRSKTLRSRITCEFADVQI